MDQQRSYRLKHDLAARRLREDVDAVRVSGISLSWTATYAAPTVVDGQGAQQGLRTISTTRNDKKEDLEDQTVVTMGFRMIWMIWTVDRKSVRAGELGTDGVIQQISETDNI